MASVYLSIGSNIDREANLCTCMQQLRHDFVDILFSQVYETPAVGFEGEPFLNLAAGFTTELTPKALKQYLRQMEAAQGRIHGEKKFSARTLDLDLLLYDTLDLHPEHNLPHSDILTYPFVLFPLAEIAPTVLHPSLQQTIAEIADNATLPRDTLSIIQLPCNHAIQT